MKDEALKLALEALEHMLEDAKQERLTVEYWNECVDAINACEQALSAPVQDSTCNNALREQGKAYPRTCKTCKFGPCIALANLALDKKAENARELRLDYEPVQEPVATIDSLEQEIYENTREFVSLNVMEWLLNRLNTTPPAAQRPWVGLTAEERAEIAGFAAISDWHDFEVIGAVEAKLKERNT
jgi:hypothetical protein